MKAPSPWRIVVTGFLGTAVAIVLTVAFVEHRSVQRQRQICGIIRIIDDRNQAMAPSTDPATTEFRRELHAYRVSLGC